MRLKNLFLLYSRYSVSLKSFVNSSKNYDFRIIYYRNYFYPQTKFLSTSAFQNRRISQESGDSDDEFDIEYDYRSIKVEEGYARDLLYKNSKDLLLNRIYCCASVQELFNVLNHNQDYYKCEHVTQTIFVLYDLLKIYEDINSANMKNVKQASSEFFGKLQDSDGFHNLIKLVNDKINYFDSRTLSYCVLYLNKLGVNIENPTMQLLIDILKKKLIKQFSISSASRYLKTVFSENTLRSYFMSQELIPLVIKNIELCTSSETLHDVSLCLNKLHNIVTGEILDNYKQKVEKLIQNGRLKSSDYKTVLQIISFLNYPRWRDMNTVLISKCILLIKSSLSELNISELTLLYEVFFKIQEPGEILDHLQRCSSKFFHQLDDSPTAQKISLFSTLIYFASPHLRMEFQKTLKGYVQECNNYDNLLLLRKLLSYIKISDIKLSHLYWNKVLSFLKIYQEDIDFLKLAQNYINFSSDVDNYRNHEFEEELLKLFETLSREPNYAFFPQKIAKILSFVFIYGNNTNLLEYLIEKVESNWTQLRHIDCLRLSYSLKLFNEMDKTYLKKQFARRIDKTVDKIILKEAANVSNDLWKNNAIVRSCLYKNKIDTILMDKLLNNYKDFEHISSKNIENIYHCLLMTNALIPEVLDNIMNYIITYKSHVLGFNAARIVYLCFCLGYHPKNMPEYCKTATDIIIRDQERMTGLLLLYSALALSFFNKLPNSLIKSIFNVEFMDKLDKELQNCYAREKYPQRVRNYLMQLNRAVCIDYPESRVPWFHQKYINDSIRARRNKPSVFANKVNEYLRIIQNNNVIEENVITPYGYEVDFVIHLNNKDEVVDRESQFTKKLALILVPEYAYTRIIVQLKGSFQLKKRHLEILGYKVIFIKFSDWISLFYAEERIDFLQSLIWPKRCSCTRENNNR